MLCLTYKSPVGRIFRLKEAFSRKACKKPESRLPFGSMNGIFFVIPAEA